MLTGTGVAILLAYDGMHYPAYCCVVDGPAVAVQAPGGTPAALDRAARTLRDAGLKVTTPMSRFSVYTHPTILTHR